MAVAMTDEVARVQAAGRLQQDLVIFYVFASLPYMGSAAIGGGIPGWVVIFFFLVMPVVLYSYSVGIRRWYETYRADEIAVTHDVASAATMRVAPYLNALAGGDVVWLFLVILGTGGLTGSSYVPFLLMVPAFSMIYGATAVGRIKWAATFCFGLLGIVSLVLASVEASRVPGWLSKIAEFRGSRMEVAYAWSLGISTIASVWVIHFQHSVQSGKVRQGPVETRGAK